MGHFSGTMQVTPLLRNDEMLILLNVYPFRTDRISAMSGVCLIG
jgi:hypothetical protein